MDGLKPRKNLLNIDSAENRNWYQSWTEPSMLRGRKVGAHWGHQIGTKIGHKMDTKTEPQVNYTENGHRPLRNPNTDQPNGQKYSPPAAKFFSGAGIAELHAELYSRSLDYATENLLTTDPVQKS